MYWRISLTSCILIEIIIFFVMIINMRFKQVTSVKRHTTWTLEGSLVCVYSFLMILNIAMCGWFFVTILASIWLFSSMCSIMNLTVPFFRKDSSAMWKNTGICYFFVHVALRWSLIYIYIYYNLLYWIISNLTLKCFIAKCLSFPLKLFISFSVIKIAPLILQLTSLIIFHIIMIEF
jgi:hypothetical protein